MIPYPWFLKDVDSWFFWVTVSLDIDLDIVYRSTDLSNVVWSRSASKSIIARFPTFSIYKRHRKNPKARLRRTTHLFAKASYYPLI